MRGYAQLDPLVEYKNEAFTMFEKLIGNINFEVTRRLYRVEVSEMPKVEQGIPQVEHTHKPKPQLEYKSASSVDPFKQKPTESTNEPSTINHHPSTVDQPSSMIHDQSSNVGGFKVIPPGSTSRKLGRNDPCWCGSGKKYKKCHFPN